MAVEAEVATAAAAVVETAAWPVVVVVGDVVAAAVAATASADWRAARCHSVCPAGWSSFCK